MKKFLTTLIIGLLGSASFVSTNSASAAAGDSIALYFSAPFVQGSHLSGPGVKTETFDDMPSGTCQSASVIGTISGTCLVEDTGVNKTPDAFPKIGEGLSNFVWNSNGTTYTFTNPVKYVGLWWFSGNSGNTIRFYDEANALIATMNSSDIISFLGTPGYASLTNADTGTLIRADGQTVLRKHYYRAPLEYTGTVEAPVTDYNVDSYKNEPWAFLNLFVSGDISVKKVVLTGSGFEIDNITTSENEASTLGSMILVKSVLGTTPSTQNISWTPTNTTADVSSGALTPNALATVTSPVSGGGAISYAVENAGTSGCTVDSSTGVVTATAAGDCVVKATAAAVNGTPSYYAASTYKTFTFTANVTITSVSPTSGSTDGGTPITINGTNFAAGATVTVGGAACTDVVVVSATSITCVTPPGTAGAKDVVVTNTDGGTATSPAFTYTAPVVISTPTITSVSPASGSTAGSTSITITGTGYVAGATVTVGGAACTDVVVVSATSITCVTPPGTAGAKDVVVTNTDTGTATSAAAFTYSNPLRTVTFKANGGGGMTYTLKSKSAAKLSANKFTRTGFVFAAWNTQADGSGTVYKNQATFQFTANATLYAQWTAVKASKRIAIFKGDDAELKPDMKYTIRVWINKLPAGTSITCEGSTSGLKVTAFDKALAVSRAKNVCEYAKTIKKSLQYTLTTNPSSANDMQARHVWMRSN